MYESDKTGKEYIVEAIQRISGAKSPYQIFHDWVEMLAISIANSVCMVKNKTYLEREENFELIWGQYSDSEKDTLRRMTGELTNAFEKEINDHLGDIYMQAGCGNKTTGQFFTSYHVSKMTAALLFKNVTEFPVKLDEPSCGAGGMIIGAAQTLIERGINPQRNLKIRAQDLDWMAVYMTYIQLSLLGLNAIVVQGDTLMEPGRDNKDPGRIWRTPGNMGALL